MNNENAEETLRRRWLNAIQGVLDGTASEASRRELWSAMSADAALRRIYEEQMAAHVALRPGGEADLQRALDQLLAARPRRFGLPRLPRFALALAATLLVCVVIAATTAVVVSSSATSEGSATAPAIRASTSEGGTQVSTIRVTASKSSASASEGSAKASLPSAAAPQATGYQPPATSQSATSYQPPATSQSATSQSATSPLATVTEESAEEPAVDWTYYPAGATGNPTNVACIWDGSNWIFSVSLNKSNLSINTCLAGSGDCYMGCNSTFKSADGVTSYVPNNFGAGVFSKNYKVTGFSLPRTLTGGLSNQTCLNATNLQWLIIRAPGLTSLNYYNFPGCTALTNVICDFSGMTIFGGSSFSGDTNLVASVADLCPPGIEKIYSFAFSSCWQLYGALTLTNVALLGEYAFSDCRSLTSIDVASTNVAVFGNGAGTFNSCSSLSNAVLRMPQLSMINAKLFMNCPLTNAWADFLPSTVTNIGTSAFTGVRTPGALELANCARIEAFAFLGTPCMTSVSFLSKGGVSLGRESFRSCPLLRNVLFASTNAPSFDYSTNTGMEPFTDTWLTNVTFYGTAPTNNAMLGLAVFANRNGSRTQMTNECVIYCSKNQAGWTALAAPFLNDAERANAPAGCFGVYTNSMGWRLAWMVHRKSPYDGAGGFVIRICDNNVTVPYDWISNNLAKADCASDMTISNALVSTGANGLNRWVSYALGLEPDNPSSVVLCDAKQDANARTATFCARNVAPNTNQNLSVQYVLEGSPDGRTWPYSLVSATNAISLSLPAAYSFFRVRADILIQ